MSRVNALLDKGEDAGLEDFVNKLDDNGRTPLHYAAMTGQATAGSTLLELDANPAIADNDGNTALHMTAIHGKQLVTSMLAWAMSASMCDMHCVNKKGNTALHEAALYDHEKVAWQVIEKSDVDMKEMKNADGKTAMDLAIASNSLKV